MSSHRLSVSGERDSTVQTGKTYSAAQYNAKPGDSAGVTLNSFREFIITLPPTAVLERYNKDEHEYFVLRVVGGPVTMGDVETTQSTNLSVTCIGFDAERNVWPHTNIDVRKQGEGDPLAWLTDNGYEKTESTRVGEPVVG